MSCEDIHDYIRQLLNHAVHKQHQFTDQECLDHGQGGTLGGRQICTAAALLCNVLES